MASDVAQVEPRRKHHRTATSPDGGCDGESNMISKRHKRNRRLPHHVSEMADVEVDCDGISDEIDGSARDFLSSPTDGPRSVPAPSKARDDDDLEEGEILDNEGASQNPVHDAESSLKVMESNVMDSIADTAFVSDASRKDENEVCAPHKSSSREKSGYFADNVLCAKSNVSDSKMSFPDNAPSKYRTLGNSPYSGRYEDDWFESHDHLRDRSYSTFREEDAPLKGRKHSERDSPYYLGRYRGDYDSDDRKVSSFEKSGQHGSRDVAGDVKRERGSSHSRYVSRDDRHQGRDGTGNRNVGREMEPGRKREERDRSRDRDSDKDRNRSYQERSTVRDLERDGRGEKQKDHRKEKEIDRVKRREKERDLNGDSKRYKYRRSESQRDKSHNRMLDKDRKSGKEDDRRGDENIIKDKSEDKKRDGDYDREKQSRRNRGRERERENFEDLSRERSRRSNQEVSEDRKWAELWDVRNVNRHENYEDRGKSVTDSMESTKDSQTMDEDEHGDSEENFSFVVHGPEEDHLNKIREESRRLTQAILEKHKNRQQLQKQKDVETEVSGTVQGRTISSSDLCRGSPEELGDGGEDYVAEISFSVKKSPLRNGIAVTEKASGDGTPKSERSDDAFHDGIFGDSPAGTLKTDDGCSLLVEKSGLSDNWDDAEGYYCYTLGEVLDGRYQVIAAHGKGVFSTVVRAKDIHAGVNEPKEVAVKILRNKEAMYKAGIEELGILKKLVGADPDDKRHCVRLLSSFKFRNHLCLVFESLKMNLREVLKKFGRNIGLRLTAVRAYAKQLFIALKHLRNCGVLHCDIKPDNMLVNEAKNILKLCDFGNAMFSGKNEITPYLVSRFYRAPEIILGLPYDHPMDIWSVGCCLYELYTGKVLFPGPSNNDMLRLHMELKGPFPKKMLRKGAFTDQHFDQDLNFIATEEDPMTKKVIRRVILNVKPKDIGFIIKGSSDEDPKMVANFKDLLDKIFALDPDKRMTVQQALNHPFVTGK